MNTVATILIIIFLRLKADEKAQWVKLRQTLYVF